MRFSFFLALAVIFSADIFNVSTAREEVVVKPFKTAKLRAKSTPDEGLLKFDPLKLGKLDITPTAKLRAQSTPDKGWETAVVKFNAGAKLEKLDRASTGEWKTTYDKLKAANQLKNVDEVQAAKITDDVAQEIAKNPSKWRYVKEAMEITFGAVLAALVFVGLQSMVK